MTAYTTISDATLTAGKPVQQATMRALRDNPKAIAEGATGAPRVLVPDALETASNDTSKSLRPDGTGGMILAGSDDAELYLTRDAQTSNDWSAWHKVWKVGATERVDVWRPLRAPDGTASDAALLTFVSGAGTYHFDHIFFHYDGTNLEIVYWVIASHASTEEENAGTVPMGGSGTNLQATAGGDIQAKARISGGYVEVAFRQTDSGGGNSTTVALGTDIRTL